MRNQIFAAGLALALTGGALAAQAQQQQQDANKDAQSFIKTAIQHNYAEIDTGKLAQEKAKSDAVKQFGAMMVKDHGEALEKAKTVAKQIGIDSPPESADMVHQAGYLKLKVLSGETFDRSYVNDMVEDHEKDVKEFEKASAMSGPAGEFAKEVLPTLQKHLTEIRKLDQQVNAATVGGGSSSK